MRNNPFTIGSKEVDNRLGNTYPIINSVHEHLKEIVFTAMNLDYLVPRDLELGVDTGGNLLWRKIARENEETEYEWEFLINLPGMSSEIHTELLVKINQLLLTQEWDSDKYLGRYDYSKGGQDPYGKFVESAEEIANNTFSDTLKNYAISSPYPAVCVFNLMDSVYDSARIGYVDSDAVTGGYKIPICKIEAMGTGVPFLPSPIDGYKAVDSSICDFVVSGDKPVHADLHGNISLMLRVSKSLTNSHEIDRVGGFQKFSTRELTLMLTNRGELEQERSNSYLIGNSYLTGSPYFKIYSGSTSPASVNGIPSIEFLNESLSTHTTLIDSGVDTSGYMYVGSIKEELTEDSRAVTTAWIPVGLETMWYLKPEAGDTSIVRLQFKDMNGRIYYDTNMSEFEGTAHKLIHLDIEAEYYRISYYGIDDQIAGKEKGIKIYKVNPQQDACFGLWTRMEINIDTFTTFLPKGIYSFAVQMWGSNRHWVSLDNQGLKVISGSIRFNYDYSEQIKNLVHMKKLDKVNIT